MIGTPKAGVQQYQARIPVLVTKDGNTEGIAKQIQEKPGDTMLEIKIAVPYSEDYDTTERQGRKENSVGYRPALAETAADLDSYDTILLGLFTRIGYYLAKALKNAESKCRLNTVNQHEKEFGQTPLSACQFYF